MTMKHISCPDCGTSIPAYRNPFPTVDIIIELQNGIVLIKRKNPPFGWALPGGFVDYGESLEDAAVREAREETSLEITDLKLLGCYSDPSRDSRMHTISVTFVAVGHGIPCAADDAVQLEIVTLDRLPNELCFDHGRILSDYVEWKNRNCS